MLMREAEMLVEFQEVRGELMEERAMGLAGGVRSEDVLDLRELPARRPKRVRRLSMLPGG